MVGESAGAESCKWVRDRNLLEPKASKIRARRTNLDFIPQNVL